MTALNVGIEKWQQKITSLQIAYNMKSGYEYNFDLTSEELFEWVQTLIEKS